MYDYLFILNILASYILWGSATLVMYEKIKNKFIYVVFPTSLYALPVLFFAYTSTNRIIHIFGLISCLILLSLFRRSGERHRTIALFIPFPLIMCIVYELLMVS